MLIVALGLAGPAVAQQGGVAVPTPGELTAQAGDLEEAIRRSQTPDARARLVEQLELVLHQLGPTDANGRRIQCKAMWHDRALVRLEGDVKRLSAGDADPAGADARTLVRLLRLQVRRMAKACLTHGWRIYTGLEKYQVDVFGQYLVNNLPALDRLAQRVGGLPAAAPAEGAPASAASPLDQVRAGLAKMTEAADALDGTTSVSAQVLIPPLARFVGGLSQVREAVETVKATAPGSPAAVSGTAPPSEPAGVEPSEAAEPSEPPPAEGEAAGPPPMTEAEKGRIEAVRAAAASLQGPEWDEVRSHLERFAAMVEAGFGVVSARPKARQLLAETERAARLARNFGTSQLMDEAIVQSRREQLAKVLALMADPAGRADGYALLDRLYDNDTFRRRLEGTGIPADAGRTFFHAYTDVVDGWRRSGDREAVHNATRLTQASWDVVRTLEKMAAWPPAEMPASLKACYRRQADLFKSSVTEAAVAVKADPGEGLASLESAAQRGSDLALVVRAETVVQAIKKYRPAQASGMYQRMIEAAQGLTVNPEAAVTARRQLLGLVRPFEDLETFPAPEPADQRALSRLLGRTYAAAAAKLSRDLGAGINAAAQGNTVPLAQALRAEGLFRLARTRALAEQEDLARVPVGNLASFSVPAEVWTVFSDGLDRQLQAMFSDYLRGRETTGWPTEPAALEAVYAPVVEARRATLDDVSPGESALDALLRNLRRATVVHPPVSTQDAWTVGYHVTEAAAATVADLDTVTQWHQRQMWAARTRLQRAAQDAQAAKPVAGE
jgi:hypothetical protein